MFADDDPAIRQLVRLQARATPELRIVGEASDGEELFRLLLELDVDAVLLDLHMPTSGLLVLPALRALAPSASVVAWSGDADALATALSLGAHAACDKMLPWAELADVVAGLVAGRVTPLPAHQPLGLVHIGDLPVVGVADFTAPVPSTAEWPCPSCRDRRPLVGAKKVRVRNPATDGTFELLICALCAESVPLAGPG